MDRDLAAFAASPAPLAERLRVARDLARAVAALHAQRRRHGALRPGAVRVVDGRVVLLAPAAATAPLDGAGFDAPEVARGGAATRRSDDFSAGALAHLALAGRGPFDAADPLESIRRVLHGEPEPVRLRAPALPLAADAALAAALAKRPRRRASAAELARTLEALRTAVERAAEGGRAAPTDLGMEAVGTGAAETPTTTPTPIPTSPTALPFAVSVAPAQRARSRTAAATPTAAALRAARPLRGLAAALRARLPAAAATARALSPGPALTLARAAAVALAVAALAGALAATRDGPLEREIAELLARGELAAARERLERAASAAPGDPLVEKLRADVACARGAPGECLRRYRIALAARPRLGEDPALRANVRRLLASEQPCGTRRAAAHLLGELRDPESLPALEAARRSGGIFAAFCTGDAIDRAISATRADLRR